MAFLDNSGDIILDAVLTDTGRYRLAKGDGSFRVAKFALGDDEINYKLYDKNNASGSAYYDLSLLQTPILEAITDNASGLKSKLMTISRNNLLFLPILKLNEIKPINKRSTDGYFLVGVDSATEDVAKLNSTSIQGLLKGFNTTIQSSNFVKIDQGLDTEEISPQQNLEPDLIETQYIIEIDNRLGSIIQESNGALQRASYVDDDNIASYFFSLGTDSGMVNNITTNSTDSATLQEDQTIRGPRGTYIHFKVRASIQLQTSTFLFDQLGAETSITVDNGPRTFRYIDTNVRIIGATTGYRIDIPFRFLKVKPL